MAEILSAGVFIEEVASGQNVVQSVSTSNMGIVGFTPQGPTDKATLVTSYAQFGRIFGADNKNSLLVKSVAAFYANGGKRAFIVRVMPSDAILANGRIQSKTYNQNIETGDGIATVYSKTNPTTSPLKDNAGATPLVPGTFTASFRGVGDTLTADPARQRDGLTPLIGIAGPTLKYEGRIDPYKHLLIDSGAKAIYYRSVSMGPTTARIAYVSGGALTVAVVGNDITVTYSAGVSTGTQVAAAVNASPAASALVVATALGGGAGVVVAVQSLTALAGITSVHDPLDIVTSGTGGVDVVVGWTDGTGAKTATFPAASAGPIVVGTVTNGSATFDRRTGFFSISVDPATVPTTAAFTVTGVAASDTNTVVSSTTITAVGKSLLTGAALSGTGISVNYVNVVDGTYSFELSAGTKFHKNAKLIVNYTIDAWEMKPISKGVWGNNLRLDIFGNANYFTAATATYSRHNVNVLMEDPTTGVYSVVETYEELVMNDPTSAVFFPDVLNELSDYVMISEPGGNEAPGTLNGVSRAYSVGGGDESTGGKAFSLTLANGPIALRSAVFTFISSADGLTYTITDDGSGTMTGAVDVSGTNTINYTSGAVSFSTAAPVKVATLVTVAYRSAPDENLHTELMGDPAKLYSYTLTVGGVQSFYTAGSDGTFTTSTYSRNQFTSPTLITGGTGLYALDRIDEVMQVVVPDFAGDEVVSGDLLDYAEGRANSPSGGDRFVILTVPKGSSPQEAVDWFRYRLQRFSKFAAIYWPWIRVADPLSNGRNLTMPPMGHIAGIYARTDSTRNVGKSPGGTVDGQLQFLTGLEYESTLNERDFVYPNKINPLISSAQTGLAVWGVRTIAIESEWRYINARRLFMFLEKSVFNSTHWIVFENNGPALWAKIKAQIGGFLTNLFNEGYFAGASPSAAFFVTVDESNNPQTSIDIGQVIIDVGVAPNKPAEFVRFRFQQKSL